MSHLQLPMPNEDAAYVHCLQCAARTSRRGAALVQHHLDQEAGQAAAACCCVGARVHFMQIVMCHCPDEPDATTALRMHLSASGTRADA